MKNIIFQNEKRLNGCSLQFLSSLKRTKMFQSEKELNRKFSSM